MLIRRNCGAASAPAALGIGSLGFGYMSTVISGLVGPLTAYRRGAALVPKLKNE